VPTKGLLKANKPAANIAPYEEKTRERKGILPPHVFVAVFMTLLCVKNTIVGKCI
jgi:hypothetical protein